MEAGTNDVMSTQKDLTKRCYVAEKLKNQILPNDPNPFV